jgi:hypothetical protein
MCQDKEKKEGEERRQKDLFKSCVGEACLLRSLQLVRNAESWPNPLTPKIRICILMRSPGEPGFKKLCKLED